MTEEVRCGSCLVGTQQVDHGIAHGQDSPNTTRAPGDGHGAVWLPPENAQANDGKGCGRRSGGDFEAEYARLRRDIERLCRGALLLKKVAVKGEQNFVRTGGNIIAANHIGSFKDVAVLLRVVPRRIFFTANAQIFSRPAFQALVRDHLLSQLKSLGCALDWALMPLTSWFVRKVSDNIGRIGTIPVDLNRRRSLAFSACRDYVLDGRVVVAFQGLGIVPGGSAFPYLWPLRPGPAVISYQILEREGLEVPVTPLAIWGTHYAWIIPTTVYVKVGEPMFVSDFLGRNRSETISRFRASLETRVSQLLLEILRSRTHSSWRRSRGTLAGPPCRAHPLA